MKSIFRVKIIFLIIFLISFTLYSEENIDTTYSFGVGYDSFTIPERLYSESLIQSNPISGNGITIRFRKYGREGINSAYINEFVVRFYGISTGGYWQLNDDDYVYQIYGKLNIVSISYSKIIQILPSLPLTPYVGIGIGAGMVSLNSYYVKYGRHGEEQEPYKYESLLPIIRIPIGIAGRFKDFEINVEFGIENGIYFHVGFLYNFFL